MKCKFEFTARRVTGWAAEDVQSFGEAMSALCNQFGRVPEVDEVLAAAKPASSPLHRFVFERSIKDAAEEYFRTRTGHLMKMVVLVDRAAEEAKQRAAIAKQKQQDAERARAEEHERALQAQRDALAAQRRADEEKARAAAAEAAAKKRSDDAQAQKAAEAARKKSDAEARRAKEESDKADRAAAESESATKAARLATAEHSSAMKVAKSAQRASQKLRPFVSSVTQKTPAEFRAERISDAKKAFIRTANSYCDLDDVAELAGVFKAIGKLKGGS